MENGVGKYGRALLLLLLAPAILPGAGPRVSTALLESEGTVFAIVQFQPGLTLGEPDRILKEAGIRVLQNPDLLAGDRLVVTDPDGMDALAALPQALSVYPASMEMIAGVPVRGCPGSMSGGDQEADFLFYSVGGWFTVLGGKPLYWNLGKPSSSVPASLVRSLVEKAAAEWSRPVELTFTYNAASVDTTVRVEFYRGEHDDNYPFNGRSGSLAHGFYPAPWNNEPLAGDIHLDDAEPWINGGNPDLYSVLLHEMGHALGLQHSSTPGNVMYPYYRQLDKLQDEDIQDLRRFFPARSTPLPAVPPDLKLDIVVPAPAGSATVDISGTVTNAVGTADIAWQMGSSAGHIAATSLWTVKGLALNPGANAATFTASDTAGRRVTKSVIVTRVAPGTPTDTVSPSLTVQFPSTTIYGTSAAKLRIRGTARDNAGVQEVTWQCGSTSGVATGTTTWNFELPLRIGDNSVIVRAKDPTGNTSWRSLTITRR